MREKIITTIAKESEDVHLLMQDIANAMQKANLKELSKRAAIKDIIYNIKTILVGKQEEEDLK